MKKVILLTTILLSVLLLTGCQSKVDILPDTINVVYDKARYEDGNFYIETYITNGFDVDYYVGYMEFSIYTNDDQFEVAAAGFEINETVMAGDYIEIELEFSSIYIFMNEQTLISVGFTVEDLVLYFYLD